MKICPVCPQSELYSTYHAVIAHSIDYIAEFWLGERCSTCVEAWSILFWIRLCTSKYGHAMAKHNRSIFPFSPTREHRLHLHGSTTTCLCISRFMVGAEGWSGCMRSTTTCLCISRFIMVGAEGWSGCMRSLTQLVCTPATPLIA
jgi:hypothetical protein